MIRLSYFRDESSEENWFIDAKLINKYDSLKHRVKDESDNLLEQAYKDSGKIKWRGTTYPEKNGSLINKIFSVFATNIPSLVYTGEAHFVIKSLLRERNHPLSLIRRNNDVRVFLFYRSNLINETPMSEYKHSDYWN